MNVIGGKKSKNEETAEDYRMHKFQVGDIITPADWKQNYFESDHLLIVEIERYATENLQYTAIDYIMIGLETGKEYILESIYADLDYVLVA